VRRGLAATLKNREMWPDGREPPRSTICCRTSSLWIGIAIVAFRSIWQFSRLDA
jgi:hypothetical protein